MATLTELRESTSDGTLPAFAWPGAYQMVYYTEGGLTVCPKCANDPDTSDPVIAGDVYWEGPILVCEDRGELIKSAYGDPAFSPYQGMVIEEDEEAAD